MSYTILPPNSSHIDQLDGLRGIAVVMVVVAHLFPMAELFKQGIALLQPWFPWEALALICSLSYPDF